MARPELLVAPVTLEALQARRDEILAIVEAHRATNVRVFGSVARGEATAASDIDFLIDSLPGHSLLDRAGIVQDLDALLGVRVDVGAANELRDRIRPHVVADAVCLSGQVRSGQVRERPLARARFNRDREGLLQILEAIARVETGVARGHDAFHADELVQTYIAYWLAGVGESVKGLSGALRARHPEAAWRDAAAMRDVISHNYFGSKLDPVWHAATEGIPLLRAAVERILATDPAVREDTPGDVTR